LQPSPSQSPDKIGRRNIMPRQRVETLLHENVG
jgi:hypothetical protein